MSGPSARRKAAVPQAFGASSFNSRRNASKVTLGFTQNRPHNEVKEAQTTCLELPREPSYLKVIETRNQASALPTHDQTVAV